MDAARAQRQFERDGFLVVRGAVERTRVDALRRTLHRAIVARLKSAGSTVDEAADLDGAFAQLAALDERYVGELFRVVRETVELYELLLAPRLLEVVRGLIPQATLHVLPEAAALRVDRRVDAKRAFHWHYDYSYISMSENGITGWYPLAEMEPALGYLRVIPGSHRTLTPVRYREEYSGIGKFLGHNVYELYGVSREELEARGVDVEVELGDALFIHGRLLHRSGENRTPRGRWTVLGRYGDLLDPALVARGWNTVRGTHAPRLFNELHPELVHAG